MFNAKYANSEEFDNSIFERPEGERLYRSVPKLIVGFDTETTGFKPVKEEPVSYGMVVYRHGKKTDEHEHFLVHNGSFPNSPGATSVHHFTDEDLESSYSGNIIKDHTGNIFSPALHPQVGINRFVQRLAHYQKQGAVFLGSNLGFDHNMLEHNYARYNRLPISSSGFDLADARKRTINTDVHEGVIEPRAIKDRKHPGYKSHGLEQLCSDYGVDLGRHTSMDDANAAVKVFLKQVDRVKREGR